MVEIKVLKIDKGLKDLHYAHPGDAGIDLYSAIDCVLKPFERKVIPTGIKIAIPQGYAGFVLPKSGLAARNGISLVNTPGLIDSGYRGEVRSILINLDSKNDFHIKRGDKICQLVIQKIEEARILEVEELDSTSRGEGGFGSTGK